MQILNIKSKILNHSKGFIFLEILVAVALISIVFMVLLGMSFSALNISHSIQQKTKIDSLIKEELEATRSFRDGSTWAANGLGPVNFGAGNPYYLILDNSQNPPKWKLQSGTETVGIFTRNVVFDKVSRDPANNNIESAYNSAHDDPDTRKVTVSVVWSGKTSQVVTYLTNWQK